MTWRKWRLRDFYTLMSAEQIQHIDKITADLQKLVGVNLRVLREERRLSQEQLAYIAGLATRHLQKIEAGQINVTLRTLARIGVALEIEPEILLVDQSQKES